MFDILIKGFAKDNNVTYVSTRERAIKSKYIINLSLHIKREILELYNRYIELFLIAI